MPVNQPINPSVEETALDDETRQAAGLPPPIEPEVSFPWGMFCLAGLFDLIGLIPFINFFSEALAGLIFGFWQKRYAPKTDPILTFIIAKIMDAVSVGILPSNIGVVVYAYIKKKAEEKTAAGKISLLLKTNR